MHACCHHITDALLHLSELEKQFPPDFAGVELQSHVQKAWRLHAFWILAEIQETEIRGIELVL